MEGVARVVNSAFDTPITIGVTDCMTRYGFRQHAGAEIGRRAHAITYQRVGGLTEFLRVGHMSDAFDVRVSSHLFPERAGGQGARTAFFEWDVARPTPVTYAPGSRRCITSLLEPRARRTGGACLSQSCHRPRRTTRPRRRYRALSQRVNGNDLEAKFNSLRERFQPAALTRLSQGPMQGSNSTAIRTVFAPSAWPERRALFERLAAQGQRPRTMVIACSDSRVDPSYDLRRRPR